MTKLANVNLALYKRLQMFVHAERASDGPEIMDSTLSIVVRIGKDFDNSNNTSLKTKGANNFYEYELPLVMSKEMGGLPSQPSVIQRVKPGKRIIEEGSFAAKGPVAMLERCDAQKSLTRENGYSRWQIRHAVNNVRLRVLTSSS